MVLHTILLLIKSYSVKSRNIFTRSARAVENITALDLLWENMTMFLVLNNHKNNPTFPLLMKLMERINVFNQTVSLPSLQWKYQKIHSKLDIWAGSSELASIWLTLKIHGVEWTPHVLMMNSWQETYCAWHVNNRMLEMYVEYHSQFKLKADRPHPRNYPHTPTDYRHTD